MKPELGQALANCMLCQRRCAVNRMAGQVGYCGAGQAAIVARAALHFWEEPCLSGQGGAGAVFFSHCNMRCVYCQNYLISHGGQGQALTQPQLSQVFLRLQQQGAQNLDLVTPGHYIPQVLDALDTARAAGLTLPVVYNTGSYETPQAMDLLAGNVDVYLPDLKYFSDTVALRYSSAPDYFYCAAKTIDAMVQQVGRPRFRPDGAMEKGVIVRHLMLPGRLFDTKKILDYLYGTFGDDIYISLMSQYVPAGNLEQFPELRRFLPRRQYEAMVEYAAELGIENCYIQQNGADSDAFIPAFDGEGLTDLVET